MSVLHFEIVPHPSHTSTFTSNLLKYRGSKRLKIAPSEDSVKGIILALCCHHCCSWPQYVGRPFLQNLGFTAEDFHLLCCLSSWATCGIRAKKRQKGNTGETVDDHTGNSLFVVSQYYLILKSNIQFKTVSWSGTGLMC